MDIHVQKDSQQLRPLGEDVTKEKIAADEVSLTDFDAGEKHGSAIPQEALPATPGEETSDPLGADPARVFNMRDASDMGIGRAIKSAAGEFRSLEYSTLLPVGRIFSGAVLKKRAVRWVVFFGLMPLLFLVLKKAFEWSFEQSAWLFGAYFCFFWALYFHGLLEPTGNIWRRGLKWAAFTVLVGIPTLLAAQTLPLIRGFYAHANAGFADTSFIYRCFGFIFIVGLLEETCKALPLLLFSLRKNESLSKRNGMFLGMMSGFGFAVSEVVTYSVQYWNTSAQVSAQLFADSIHQSTNWLGMVDTDALAERINDNLPALVEFYGDMVLSQIVRFMTLPLLHAIWTGVVGWFVAVSCQRSKSRWPVVVVGILLMAVVHGLYDTFSASLLGVGIAAMTILIFMTYLIQGDKEVESTESPMSSTN